MAQQVRTVNPVKSPWKLTVTRSWGQGISMKSRDEILYFTRDTRYKSFERWEVKPRDVSNISRLTIERTDKYSLQPQDSWECVLKITGIQEQHMGSVCGLTPSVSYNPKPFCGHITKNNVVKVYVYGRMRGLSGSKLYQSAADQFNIFMAELRGIWRDHMVDELVMEKILKQKQFKGNQELSANDMFIIMKVLFKRCKSNKVWNDFERAYKESFGEIENKMESNQTSGFGNGNNIGMTAGAEANSNILNSQSINTRNVDPVQSNRFGTNNNMFAQTTPFGGQSGHTTRSGFVFKQESGGGRSTGGNLIGGNQSNNVFRGFGNQKNTGPSQWK